MSKMVYRRVRTKKETQNKGGTRNSKIRMKLLFRVRQSRQILGDLGGDNFKRPKMLSRKAQGDTLGNSW